MAPLASSTPLPPAKRFFLFIWINFKELYLSLIFPVFGQADPKLEANRKFAISQHARNSR
jgi:hypothetical protein